MKRTRTAAPLTAYNRAAIADLNLRILWVRQQAGGHNALVVTDEYRKLSETYKRAWEAHLRAHDKATA